MAQRMAHAAEHDFLTGLPNRMLLNDRVDRAIGLVGRHTTRVAMLFLDLDGFKHINDSLGHSTGDKLLQSVARRLVECVRDSDTVSRQGGDEFVVLLSEMQQWEDAALTAKRMLLAVAKGHSIDEHDLHLTTSIGISVYPDDGLDAETLIKNADTAMYQAKENGRSRYQFFEPAMNVRAVERHSIEESSAARPGTAGVRAALPAQDRSADRSDHRGGSVDTLDPPDPRADPPIPVYSRRGGLQPHSADRRLGPAGSVRASPSLGGCRAAAHDHGRQRLSDRVSTGELSRKSVRHTRRDRPRSTISPARADRKRPDEACQVHGIRPPGREGKRGTGGGR